MITVTADGVDLRSIGLGVKKYNIPPLPPTRDNIIELAERDGELDFGSSYGPRTFDLECVLMADDPSIDYHNRVAQVVALFNAKKGDIAFTFSDRPGKKYIGRYSGTMSIEKIIFDGNITIPIKMGSNPFPVSLHDTAVREYGQGLEYGQGHVYSDYSVEFSGAGSMVVRNEGTLPQSPVIRIRGAFTNLTLSDGTTTLTLSGSSAASDVWEINCEKYSVKLNGTNAYGRSNGVFFTLNPGNTTFTVSGSGINLSLAFEFHYKYLY